MDRHKIIASIGREEQCMYVPEEINEILGRLSFKPASSFSQIYNWELFTRKRENNEFAAIYENRKNADKRFLVEGAYSDINVPKKNLKIISDYFSRGLLKRIAKSEGGLTIGGVALGSAIAFYYVTGKSDPAALKIAVLMIPSGAIFGGVTSKVLESLINRYYGSKLSKEAENYNYGELAVRKLREESIFEKVKSGELTRQDFLKLRENQKNSLKLF